MIDINELAATFKIEDRAALKEIIDEARLAAEGVPYWRGDPAGDDRASDELDDLVRAVVRVQHLMADERNIYRLAENLGGLDRVHGLMEQLEAVRDAAAAAHVKGARGRPLTSKRAAVGVLAVYWRDLGRPVNLSGNKGKFRHFLERVLQYIHEIETARGRKEEVIWATPPSIHLINDVVSLIRQKTDE